MKLWHSFVKELVLASRSFYFYIELFMAFIFLFLLLFVIPEQFNSKSDEYVYWDMPEAGRDLLAEQALDADENGVAETVALEYNGESVSATLYSTETQNIYVLGDRETAVNLADEERAFAAIVHMDDVGEVTYTYYLQGYETERLRNTYRVFHNEDTDILADAFDNQDVRSLETEHVLLTDRENVIPSFLTFNGSLMGLFIIASYIFLDKKEGVIKAYAVTASSVWQYLMSKMGIIMLTSTVTSLLIVIPVMGLQPNYLLMLVFLLATGFAASALGLVLTSYYDNIQQAFGMLYVLIIALMLPNVAYFIPSWNPTWITFIPTYPMLEGFKEILLTNSNVSYVLLASSGFLVAGIALFLFANVRFKKTLTI
ncbi:ABC transporter permease [Candidatus Leptofilum sp.]|uniref:ABC transporter permease n=1 Tax=Candidatus Leptofilum sp. TaxID=3241576 RepID=UPI003B5A2A9F